MIGLSTLIDSLLAANAGPRADVNAIKREAEIGATGEVPLVERAENEVRLPSRAAMERLLPSAADDAPRSPGKADAPAPQSSVAFEWSAAAKIIRSVLAQERGDAGPVRSSSALWQATTPSPALAASLTGTVEHSGLFYESHLAQLSVGARTLAQLQAEPQAKWSGATAADMPAQPVAAPTQDLARVPSTDRRPEAPLAYEAGASSMSESGDAMTDVTTDAVKVVERQPRMVGEGLQPPQAVTLVHQQLDLLATSAFRWSGQAWPGVPMDWSIQAPVHERHGDGDGTSAPEQTPPAERLWLTTLSMRLPRLGAVDVRLGVAGDAVQANLMAHDAAASRLAAGDGAALASRLEAAGLRLREFQVRVSAVADAQAAADMSAHESAAAQDARRQA